MAESLLTPQACAFHRNLEISTHYAWIYKLLPTCFKWAGMAAIASHHARLALFPLRLDSDRTGYVNIPRTLTRHKSLLIQDVNTIRATNNAIYDDIFWAHLAYATADDGIARLRALLQHEAHYAPVLEGFVSIDRGRRVLEDPRASLGERVTAEELIWKGNVQLLEHEQRALVQPHFDRLSCTFARLVSMGSTTTFEVRGLHHELAYFTSFYLSSFARRVRRPARTKDWPRITDYDDRWSWIVTSVVPRFRRLDGEDGLLDASLQRIFDEGRTYSATPCVVPPAPPTDLARVVDTLCCPNAQSYGPPSRRARVRPVKDLADTASVFADG